MPKFDYTKIAIWSVILIGAWFILPFWTLLLVAGGATAGYLAGREKPKSLEQRWNPEIGRFQ